MYVCVVLTVSCIIFAHTFIIKEMYMLQENSTVIAFLCFFFFTSENLEFYGANILCDNCNDY